MEGNGLGNGLAKNFIAILVVFFVLSNILLLVLLLFCQIDFVGFYFFEKAKFMSMLNQKKKKNMTSYRLEWR